MKIQFSVIIPLYNKAETIGRAIRSVLNQEYSDFELIVVDDGSTDHGVDIVRGFHDPRIRLIQQENGGVSKARNTGIEAAKYDYLTFLDADDEYFPGFLKKMFQLLSEYPDAGIYGCGYIFQKPDGMQERSTIHGLSEDFEGYLYNYFEIASNSAPPLWTGAICVKKTAIQSIGKFPVDIRSGEDLLVWARLVLHFGVCLTRSVYSIYYIELKNKPSPPPDAEAFKDLVGIALINELQNLKQRQYYKQLKLYISFWFKMRAACCLLRRKNLPALKIALHSLCYYPGNKNAWIIIILSLFPSKISHFLLTFFRKG